MQRCTAQQPCCGEVVDNREVDEFTAQACLHLIVEPQTRLALSSGRSVRVSLEHRVAERRQRLRDVGLGPRPKDEDVIGQRWEREDGHLLNLGRGLASLLTVAVWQWIPARRARLRRPCSGSRMCVQTVVIHRVGTAGLGIADAVDAGREVMVAEVLSEHDAVRRFWATRSGALVEGDR